MSARRGPSMIRPASLGAAERRWTTRTLAAAPAEPAFCPPARPDSDSASSRGDSRWSAPKAALQNPPAPPSRAASDRPNLRDRLPLRAAPACHRDSDASLAQWGRWRPGWGFGCRGVTVTVALGPGPAQEGLGALLAARREGIGGGRASCNLESTKAKAERNRRSNIPE
jgi:hypothetical protein